MGGPGSTVPLGRPLPAPVPLPAQAPLPAPVPTVTGPSAGSTFVLPRKGKKSNLDIFGRAGLQELGYGLEGIVGQELGGLEELFGVRKGAMKNALRELDPKNDQARIAAASRAHQSEAAEEAIRKKRRLKELGYTQSVIDAVDLGESTVASGKTGDLVNLLSSPDQRLNRFMAQIGITDPSVQLAFMSRLENILGSMVPGAPTPAKPTIWENVLGALSNVL